MNLAYIYCIIYDVTFICLSYVKASAKQKLGSMFKYVVIISLVSVLFQLKREIAVERASNKYSKGVLRVNFKVYAFEVDVIDKFFHVLNFYISN